MKHQWLTCGFALMCAQLVFGAEFDWPQWQGPDRNAVSMESGLLNEWPKEGPPLAWKVKGLGGGDSAPSIANGRMFGMSHRGADEVVWALSEKDGKEIWVTRLGPAFQQGMRQSMEGPGCTPTVDGDRLYVVGLAGNVAGKTIWKNALPASTNTETSQSTAPGRGGGGNFGGFSIGNNVGPQMFSQADANKDQKLSRAEFTALADAWFDKLDPEKTGKVTATQFAERFYDAVPRPQNAPGQGAPPQRGPSRSTAPAFVTATDSDKDGSVTRDELKSTFAKWYDQWHTDKSGAVTEEKLRSGLTAALPAPQFGGGGAGGAGGGGRGFGGRGGGGGDAGAGYSSAIAIDFDGQRQYVQLTARAVIGVAASDGKFLWRYDRPANRSGIIITTPLYRDGVVFATSAYGAGGGAVKLSKDGNGGIKAEELWFSRNMENHHGGVLVIDGALYGANGGNGGGYIACLDFKTGEVLWNERDADKRRLTKGSMMQADGRIYYRTEEGPIVLIEPSRKEYLERGRFEQPDRTSNPAWAHPVIANGKLYIRDQDTLLCYDVKAGGK